MSKIDLYQIFRRIPDVTDEQAKAAADSIAQKNEMVIQPILQAELAPLRAELADIRERLARLESGQNSLFGVLAIQSALLVAVLLCLLPT